VPDMSKPWAYLDDLVEKYRSMQIDHYRKSQDHKLQGDLYQEFAAELRHRIDKEKAATAKPGAE
jgi:hypothetical protein